MIDVLVAGGGPVGLGTALLAARGGLRVAVVEPRPAPIDKACGEGLMPGAVDALQAVGVAPPGRPFLGIRYLDGARSAQARFRSGTGLGVRRTTLHAALSEATAQAGIEVLAAAVDDVRHRDGFVEAELSPRAYNSTVVRARYLVAADGLHSPLRRRLGLARPPSGPRRYGLRQHFAVAPWSDYVEVFWAARAEAYVTPVADDLVGVAVLVSGRASFDTWLDEFPPLRQRLAGAPPVSSVQGAGPLRQHTRSRVAGRVLLAGDAAGYVDAITGEGIRLGLASGAELVRCVAADRPQDYERAWIRVSREYRLLSEALVRAGQRPWLRRRIVPAASALPDVFGRAVDMIAG